MVLTLMYIKDCNIYSYMKSKIVLFGYILLKDALFAFSEKKTTNLRKAPRTLETWKHQLGIVLPPAF